MSFPVENTRSTVDVQEYYEQLRECLVLKARCIQKYLRTLLHVALHDVDRTLKSSSLCPEKIQTIYLATHQPTTGHSSTYNSSTYNLRQMIFQHPKSFPPG